MAIKRKNPEKKNKIQESNTNYTKVFLVEITEKKKIQKKKNILKGNTNYTKKIKNKKDSRKNKRL